MTRQRKIFDPSGNISVLLVALHKLITVQEKLVAIRIRNLHVKLLISILLIIFHQNVIVASCNALCHSEWKKNVTVCFRCDDFFSVENHPAKEIYGTKKSIVKIFEKHGIPLTIGLIPDVHESISEHPVQYKKITEYDPIVFLLKEIPNERNIDVAMHGLSHLQNELSKDSEWIGLDLESQIRMMREGKEILLGALGNYNIATFIPPWNSFDLNTIKALRSTGIEYLSGDVGIVRNRPFQLRSPLEKQYLNINLIPGTCSLRELSDVLKLAKNDLGGGTIIVVIFHPYDFQEYRGNRIKSKAFYYLSGLDELLGNIKKDDRLIFSTLKDLKTSTLPPSRYTAASRFYLMVKVARIIVPKKMLVYLGIIDENVGHWLEKGRYLSENNYNSLFNKVLILLGGLILSFGLVLGLLLGYFIKKKIKKLAKSITTIASLGIFLVGLLLFELRLEIVSAPNMLGILIVYCIGFSSFLVTCLASVSINKG